MEKERFCELLIVKADNRQRYVVKAPTNAAHKGNLVEFETESGIHMGTVEDKMWCVVDKEVYRCVNMIAPIYKADKIYHETWDSEKEPEWENEAL